MIYERITPLSDEEIERGRKKDPAPGYPDTAHRLKIPPQQLQRMIAENRIEIPDEGEAHFIYNHPNRVNGMAKGRRVERIITNKAPASDQEGQKWRNMGLYTDTANRALHPRFFQLLTTPDVGMYTGPGFYYGNGPQRIANLAVRRVRNGIVEYAAVGVERQPEKQPGVLFWGVPGGHVEDDQTIEEAAFEEGFQESNLQRRLMGRVTLTHVFSIPKGFRRDTIHSWGEEHFIYVESRDNPELEGVELKINDPGEVKATKWVDLETMQTTFMDTHWQRTLEYEQNRRSNT